MLKMTMQVLVQDMVQESQTLKLVKVSSKFNRVEKGYNYFGEGPDLKNDLIKTIF